MKHSFYIYVLNGLLYNKCRVCGKIDFGGGQFPVECVAVFKDNDSLRPNVDERAKQELGFNLEQPYDWSDK
jgi:hypothetical protein